MIAIATLAFFLIVIAWMAAPNGASTPRQPEASTGIAPADVTA